MLRAACGSLLALLFIQSPAVGQAVPECESAPTVEVTVWRGAQDVADLASVPERICPNDDAGEGAVLALTPFEATEWGIPGLEEIAALVFASPAVAGLSEPTPQDEIPTVLGSGLDRTPDLTDRPGAVRTVIVSPETVEAEPLIVHLMIYQASPGHVEVDVRSGAQRPIRLSWTRTPAYPEWSPGA